MYDVAIFTALSWERRAVLAALRDVETMSTPRTWRARMGDGASCLVVQTGVGPERAYRVASTLPPARLFLSSGCAGALVDHLQPGDVVIADGVAELDGAGAPARRFTVDCASVASWAQNADLRAHVGVMASSDVVLGTTHVKQQAAACGAIAVDMESGAVARAALARGIPMLVVRVVIDVLSDTLPETGDMLDLETGDVRVGRAAAALLRPWRWPAHAWMARRVRTADQHLRRFLLRLFTEGGGTALGGAGCYPGP